MRALPRWLQISPQGRFATLVLVSLGLACTSDSPLEPQPPAGGVASIAVTALRTTLAPGDTVRLTAQVMDEEGRVLPTMPVTWTSSTGAVATVDGDGLVTADSVGATTIIATSGGKQGTVDVLVLNSVLCECTVILDSTEVTLVERDDSTGVYVFQVIRGPPPELEPGSILVGAEDNGYLRRVEQVTTAGDRITVQTSVAYVEEAVRDGGFSSTSFSDDESGSAQPGGAYWGPWTTTYLAPGVSLRDHGGCCSLNDLQLQFQIAPDSNIPVQGLLTFTIKDGEIIFAPRVDIGASVRAFGLKEFHTIFRGDLGLDLNSYEVKLSVAVTKGFAVLEKQSQTFVIQQRPYATFIGPMPLIAIITKKIKLEVTPTVSASAVFTGTFKTGFGVTAGVQWRDGPGWKGVSGSSSYFEATAPEFAGVEGTASLKIAVVPEFSVEFYGVVGPFVNLEPYAEAAASTVISFADGARTGWDWETKVDLGMNLNLGAKLSLLGRKDLLSFGIAIPIIRPWRFVQLFSDGSVTARSVAVGQDIPASFGLALRPAWDPETGPKEAFLGRNHGTSTQDTILPANGSVTLHQIRSGPGAPHSLSLTNIQGNCSTTNPNPATIAVSSGLLINSGGAPSDTTFRVNCIPLGDLGISVAATGPHQPSRYDATIVRLDKVGTGRGDTAFTVGIPPDTVMEDFIPRNGVTTATGLLQVTLTPPMRNCAVTRPPDHQVTILSGDTVNTGFDVTCVPLGAVQVMAATTDPDPDLTASAAPSRGSPVGSSATSISYLLDIIPAAATDSLLVPPGSVGGNDSAMVSDLVPLYNASGAPGRYTVALTDAPNRCQESGQYRRPVTVFPGDTAVAGFTVQCVERLHVRTATTGPGTDPDGYLVVIDYADGTADTASAGINQTFGLAGVPPGDHLIRLVGVEPSCVAPAGVTRTVSGRDSTLVSFAVSCPAPPPPTGLQATLIETNRIDLGWTAVSGPVAKYRIYRNDLLHDSTAGTTFSDPGLTPFTTYSYRVSTVNTAGLEGARSGAVAARTLDATPPTAPGSLTATPVSGTRINLAWQAASDPETGVARYLIYRDGNSVATVNALSFADTGLSPGATHSYTVTAENGQGIEGPAGGPASATTLTGVVDLVVVASSSGPAPAGYTALIEMGGVRQSQSVDANGNVVFAALQPGSYSVVLQAVPGNCSVTAPNPRSVSLPAGAASVTTTFVVTCQ